MEQRPAQVLMGGAWNNKIRWRLRLSGANQKGVDERARPDQAY